MFLFSVVEFLGQDAYQVDDKGVLFESMVTTSSPNDEDDDLTDYTLIERVHKHYDQVEVTDVSDRYAEDHQAIRDTLNVCCPLFFSLLMIWFYIC